MTVVETRTGSNGSTSAQTSAQYPPGSGSDDGSGARWALAVVLGAVAIGTIGLVAIVLGSIALGGRTTTEATSTTLELSTREFSIDGQLIAPAGDVTLRISNDGSTDHNVGVRELGLISPLVGSGGVVELALGELAPGTYEIFCDVSGHEASGMINTLVITGNGPPTDGAAAAGGHLQGEEIDYAAMDNAMMESMLAFPAETEGRGNPILEPVEVKADGTKVFELTAEIVDWEVEPGKMVEAWTYNGVVPGPQIVLDRGDSVEIRVTNNLPMGTDIHWHGVHTPNDQDGVAPYTQDLIEPNGGTFTYEFTVDDDAIGMYHAHNHAQMQVVNGMFGVFRVGENPIPYGQSISGVTIPEDLELVQDIPMILNDAGTIGYSLNGKSFPATEPLVVNQGDWTSITYYNEGLQIHPMHLHQFPQLVYAKDGIPLEHPYWVDTLNVAPGERFTVLFRADDPGVWVWHCHILTHVERTDGMFGMVTAIIVNETPGFDATEQPVSPTNWRNVATTDGPVSPDDAAASHDAAADDPAAEDDS